VLRTRLLQEAAALVHLPYSALEDDLEKLRDTLSRRAAHAASYQRDAAPPAPAQRAVPPPADDDRTPLADGLAPDGGGEPLPPLLDTPPPEPLSRAERQLCELVIQHENDAPVLDLVEQFLPLDLLSHRLARDIVGAVLETRRSGVDRLAELRAALDEVFQKLFDGVIVAEGKMLSAREATPVEAARDLITRIWTLRFKQERGNLDAESTPENASKRFTLSILIKNLETLPWEKACRLMTATHAEAVRPAALPDGQPDAARHHGAAPEPCAHAGGSASEAAGPDELLPSEFPLDEMLD
jgi:hypothetical protein